MCKQMLTHIATSILRVHIQLIHTSDHRFHQVASGTAEETQSVHVAGGSFNAS